MSETDHTPEDQTVLEEIYRTAAVRSEVMQLQQNDCSRSQAFEKVAESWDASPEEIRELYFKR